MVPLPATTGSELLPPHPTLSPYYRRDDERAGFVGRLFDRSAGHYDRIERMMAMGTGSWYRRQALARAGLHTGMATLDVAIGTGLVAREAIGLTADPSHVLGLDPSLGMLLQARASLRVQVVGGRGEHLPLPDRRFDFVSMGYALRHLADLTTTFREFFRVLRPGGILCMLEWSRPPRGIRYRLLRLYLHSLVPLLTRLATGNRDAALLMRYFWDTIDACVPPERILSAMAQAGFEEVRRTVVLGMFSEYAGRRPAAPA